MTTTNKKIPEIHKKKKKKKLIYSYIIKYNRRQILKNAFCFETFL